MQHVRSVIDQMYLTMNTLIVSVLFVLLVAVVTVIVLILLYALVRLFSYAFLRSKAQIIETSKKRSERWRSNT